MHELAMAQEIVSTVNDILQEYPGKVLKKVHIKVGQFAAVVPNSLKFSYDTIVSGTPLKQSMLNIEIIPVSAICNKCKQVFSMDELEFWCPACNSPDMTIQTGDELLISNLEVE